MMVVMTTADDIVSDPSSTEYIYDSVPGILILFLRIATMAWFIWDLYATYDKETHEVGVLSGVLS